MNDFFTWITSHLDTIGIVVVGVILIAQKYMSGSSGLRKEINEEYKERNKQLEDKVQTNLDEIHKTNLVVAELRGIIQEKDRHIETLANLLKDKNPETLNLLTEIKESNKQMLDFMKQVHTFMAKQSEELGYQTEILEETKERNTKIDKASKSHVGDLTRIPRNGKKIIKRKK